MRIEEIDIDLIDTDINLRQDVGDLSDRAEIVRQTKDRIERGLRPLRTPIHVKPKENGRYDLIDGKRKYVVIKDIFKLDKIHAFIDTEDLEKRELTWESFYSNKGRKDNSWWEIAEFFKKEEDNGIKRLQIGRKARCSDAKVTQLLNALEVAEYTSNNVYEDDKIEGESYSLDYRLLYEISKFDKDYWTILVKRAIKERFSVSRTQRLRDDVLKLSGIVWHYYNDYDTCEKKAKESRYTLIKGEKTLEEIREIISDEVFGDNEFFKEDARKHEIARAFAMLYFYVKKIEEEYETKYEKKYEHITADKYNDEGYDILKIEMKCPSGYIGFYIPEPNAECEICGKKLVMSGLNRDGQVYCHKCYKRNVKGKY